MDKLKVISLNIRGLNSPKKRAKLSIYLRRKAVDIALIQETHLKKADVQRLQNKFYRVAAFSTDNTKTIHAAVEAGAFHPQLNTALISLIPKKGKDHSNCAN